MTCYVIRQRHDHSQAFHLIPRCIVHPMEETRATGYRKDLTFSPELKAICFALSPYKQMRANLRLKLKREQTIRIRLILYIT